MAEDKSTEKTTHPTKDDVEKNKVWAFVAYLGLIGLVVVLLTEAKDSPYVKFHINQALPLTIAFMVASVLLFIPILGWLVWLGLVVLWIMGVINALSGKMNRLPLIGNFELVK